MRQSTISYQERMNRVLIHIHQNLDEPLTIDRLAEVACLSPFHFHRIFTARVFLHKGPYAGLHETYRNIFAGWLAASGCTLGERPVFEKYLNRDPRRTKPENLRTEIWVPVV